MEAEDPFNRTGEFHVLASALLPPLYARRRAPLRPPGKAAFVSASLDMARDLRAAEDKVRRIEEDAAGALRSQFEEATRGEEVARCVNEVNNDIHRLQGLLEHLHSTSKELLNDRQYSNKDCKAFIQSIESTMQIKLGKITNNFRQVLKQRAENIQKHSGSLQLDSSSTSLTQANVNELRFRSVKSIEQNDNETSNNNIDMGGFQSREQLSTASLRNRMNAVRQIERTIGELQSVFRQVASMISEQDELVTIIDERTAMAEGHLEAARRIFAEELTRLMKNRGFLVKLLATILVLIVVFILFFV